MAVQGFFSPDKKTRMAGEKENNSAFNVKVEPVKVANNINQYNEQTPSLDYAPDRVGDYIRDTEVKSYRDDRTQDEKDRDAIKNFFTREDKGVFKDKDEFNRKTTTYYTDKDGYPAAVNAFGEKVNYDTDTIKRYIAQDAKEKYQRGQEQKLDQGLSALQVMNQRVDDFNYYKRNLTFDEKGEPDPNNKYVLTGPEMRERMQQLGPNESMDKYGIIRNYKEQDEINRRKDEEKRLRAAKEESENKNLFQKIGDTVGDVFNKLTGIQPAQGDTLQSQGINTSATTNIAQMGNVDPVTQIARDAVAKANLRKSGLDRTVGGQSSQANYGSGRDGNFGTGTHGKGLPSNPKGFSGYSRKTSPSTGGRPSGSKSTSRGTAGSRSRGGTGTGSSRSNTGSKSSARGARGSTGSRSRGGTGTGSSRSGGTTGRSASKASKGRTGRGRSQCDISTKIDISPLITSNLVKDNLAEVAYFVQEIKK